MLLWLSWSRIRLQCRFNPWVGKMPWRRERLPTPVSWPGEFNGLYIVHGVAESRTWLSALHFSSVMLLARSAWDTHLSQYTCWEPEETFPGRESMLWLDWPLWFLLWLQDVPQHQHQKLWRKRYITHKAWRMCDPEGPCSEAVGGKEDLWLCLCWVWRQGVSGFTLYWQI